MAAAEDVERQVAVAAVVAVEEPALLPAVDRIVRGVEIEHDLLRRTLVRFQEEVDEQGLDRRRVVADLVVARRLGPAQLQAVQRRLTGRRRTGPTTRRELAHQHRKHRIVPQPVVIVEVLVAQRLPEHTLTDQRPNLMLHQLRLTVVPEAAGKALEQAERPVGRSQQQRSTIRADRSTVECRLYPTAFHSCKTK